jgi:hypothetical protein
VHCSDPRYQPHFQSFLREGLGLDHYALVAVPGGVHFLTLVDFLPKFSWVGRRWVKFVIDLTSPQRIVLLGHDDCRWYLDGRFHADPARLRARQERDLRAVRADILDRFGPRSVDLYFARLDGDGAVFEAV